ncbi:DUF1566 domain-containing protein [bacterium]|nr:DUF1566 domain-containing protein [bacterium]
MNTRFLNNGDGTVTDSLTNLMWAARDNVTDIDWHEAKEFCDQYHVGGFSDWRLPTLPELRSLYDERVSHHVTAAIDVSQLLLWSSEFDESSENAKVYNLGDGSDLESFSYMPAGTRALPVRTEVPPSSQRFVNKREWNRD